jgi:hypothetical protein
MEESQSMMALIAKWPTYEDAIHNLPSVIQWEDGSHATLADYRGHLDDTHTWISHPHGVELHMFPDIVADVRYDALTGVWGVIGAGVQPASLSLTDLNAADDAIVAELYTFPLVYRARIHR